MFSVCDVLTYIRRLSSKHRKSFKCLLKFYTRKAPLFIQIYVFYKPHSKNITSYDSLSCLDTHKQNVIKFYYPKSLPVSKVTDVSAFFRSQCRHGCCRFSGRGAGRDLAAVRRRPRDRIGRLADRRGSRAYAHAGHAHTVAISW